MPEKIDGRRERSRITRQRVLEAAIEVFSEQGYDAATIDQIARAVGVRPSNLYYHFENKQDLLRQVVDWDSERVQSRIERELEKLESIADDVEYARRVGSTVEEIVLSEDHRVMRILFFQSLKDPTYLHDLFELFGRVFQAIGLRTAQRAALPTDPLALWLDRFYFGFVPLLIFTLTSETCAEYCGQALPEVRTKFRELLEAHDPAATGAVVGKEIPKP